MESSDLWQGVQLGLNHWYGCTRKNGFLLLLHSPAVSLGFTILGEVFAYATVS